MIRFLKSRILVIIPVITVAILVFLTWLNYVYVKKVSGGGEFFTNWQSTRSFILDGSNPYSVNATQNIQSNLGKTGLKTNTEDWTFISPFFAIYLFAPLALIPDFSFARALWMTILEALLIFAAYRTVAIFNGKTPFLISIAIGVFSIFSFQSYMALYDGSAVIVSMFLILFSVLAIRHRRDEIAGLLMAISTVQVTQTWIFLLITIVWAVIKRRTRIIAWFFAVLVLFIGFSILLLPNWIVQYASVLYKSAQGQSSALQTELVKRLSLFLDIALLLILVIEWFLAFRRKHVNHIWLFLLTMVVISWLLFTSQPNILVMSIPPFFYSLLLLKERWKEKSHFAIFMIIGLVFIVYWVMNFVTTIGGKPAGINVISWILPLISLVLLYWSRWWLIYSPLATPPENKLSI